MRRCKEEWAVRDRLVLEHWSLMLRLCERFRGPGTPLDELLDVGRHGLLEAIERYDPALRSSFIAFSIPIMIGRIREYFRSRGWAARHPAELHHRAIAVPAAVESLRRRSGRSPTLGEIAEASGLSEEEIHDSFELECAFASAISDESSVLHHSRP